MPQDPWAEFRTSPTPAPQAPAQPQQAQPTYPGVIRGAPRQPDPITPREAAADARANRQLQLREEAAARSAEAAQRGTVEQGKAASFLERAIHANDNYDALNIGPRSLPGQVIADNFPRIANQFSDADRQRADQAQREFIQAILRYDSGAAIPENEITSAAQTYFPQPGDGPEVIAQKAEARRVAIQGLIASAGPAGARFMQQQGQREQQPAGAMATDSNGGPSPQFTDPQGPQGPRPTLQDMYPEGVQFGMDNFGTTQPFDRIEYLRGLGIEPDAERQFVGIVNATARQKGPENFTREDMLNAYRQAGIQPGPDAAIDEIVAQIQAGRGFAGFDTQAAEADYTRMLDQRLQQTGDNPEGTGATIGSAASQGVTFGLADETTGVAEAIAASLRGENPITAYQVGRDTDRRFAQRAQAESPWIYGGTELGANLLTGGVRAAPAVMRAEAPIAAAAREGAILGGVTGFGHGEGLQGSTVGAATGAATGAAVGTGIAAIAPRVGNALANLRSPRPNAGEVQSVVQAGERMGVPVRRADVDPAVRDARANILQSPAGQTVRQTEADDLASLEQAVIREVGGGATTERFVAGDRAQSSLRAAIQATRNRASALYQQAGRAMGDVAAEPTEALAAVDRNIAELSQAAAGNAPAINYLRNTIRADLTREGGLTIRALLAQRQGIGRRLRDANLSDPDFERRVGEIYAAAAQDLEAAAANNPEALAQLQQANRLWAGQASVRREVGDLLLGRGRDANVPPRQAAERILGWAKNDPGRLNTMLGEVDDGTRAEIRALVAGELGRTNNSGFSLAQFLTATSGGRGGKIDARSARMLFGEGGVEAINDLRTLAQAKASAAERTNYSNTGGIVQRAGRGLRTMILGGLGLSEAGVTGGALAVGASSLIQRMGEARAVRLLTNPDFTGWLRRLPETDNPRAIDGAFARLGRVAAREAQFQSDIQAFQQALVSAANDNAGMAVGVAAQPQDQQQP